MPCLAVGATQTSYIPNKRREGYHFCYMPIKRGSALVTVMLINIHCFYQYFNILEALWFLERGCMDRNSVLKKTPNTSEHINSKYGKHMDIHLVYFEKLCNKCISFFSSVLQLHLY